LRAQLEASPLQLKKGPDFVLHGSLDFIVDAYAPIVDDAEDSVLEMEQRTLDAFLSRVEMRRLFTRRRELLKFRRILGPMEEVVGRLQSLDMPCIDPDVRPYFRDVGDHVRRVASRLGGLNDILSSVFEVANLLEQQRQGVITRKLASWAALLAVPTAIASIVLQDSEARQRYLAQDDPSARAEQVLQAALTFLAETQSSATPAEA
jgi:magnesium transporter